MLYERWRQIAREFRGETALHDLTRGERWTFAQLAAAGEKDAGASPVIFPQGPDFIFTLLRAWHSGRVVCPLEAGQKPSHFESLPPGCAHLKTTSATGGVLRVVAFTEEQLAQDADNIVATMGLRRDWPNLGVISIAHSYGFSNLALPLLLHGIPLLLVDVPLPEMVRQAADIAQSITLPAVPALWRVWHEAKSIPKNIRLAISAGAPLPLMLEKAIFDACGLKLHNFYGSSECGGIAYDASATPRTDAACAGSPMKNVQLSIGEDGCLEVRGRAVGTTYWPDRNSKMNKGVFYSSDLAEIRDGFVFLRGRAGDVINVAGRKLSPEEIEKELLSHPQVRECLVFGAPAEEAGRGEIIVACIAPNGELTRDALRQFLLERLPAWQVPREWIFIPSLEANRRGKISRTEWRARYLAGWRG
ncbi:MAG TPA: class I adenylate-forming enzyme family protein [Verrucomicrobiae bacterium]|nr:class I adenylate-forming enzyme family protein [Verrucomicrobiae bacterium]